MFVYLEPDEEPMWFPDDDYGVDEYEQVVASRYGYEPARQKVAAIEYR